MKFELLEKLGLRRNPNRCVILTYHGLVQKIVHPRLQRNFHTVQQFQDQINYLLKSNYKFLNAAELVEYFSSNSKPPKGKFVCITFDDGYENNLTAIEILNKYKLPGVFFITTAVINSQHSIWTVDLSLLLLEGNAEQIVFENNIFSLRTNDQRLNTFQFFRTKLKSYDSQNRILSFNSIIQQFPEGEIFRLIEKYSCFKMLDWSQIRSVSSNSIQFQSHGHLHEIHHENQNREEILSEFEISKRLIEKEIASDVFLFAYPNGNSSVYDRDFLAECGYSMGLSLDNVQKPGGNNFWSIPRKTPNTKFEKFKSQL